MHAHTRAQLRGCSARLMALTLTVMSWSARSPHRMLSLSLDPSGAQALTDERQQLEKAREALSKQVGRQQESE